MGPESAVTHSKKTVDPVQKPRARGRRTVRSYHIAALVFVVAVGSLLIYAIFPVLTGSTGDDERPTVDAADTAPARVGSMVVTARDLVLRAEATIRAIPACASWILAQCRRPKVLAWRVTSTITTCITSGWRA